MVIVGQRFALDIILEEQVQVGALLEGGQAERVPQVIPGVKAEPDCFLSRHGKSHRQRCVPSIPARETDLKLYS